MFWMFSELQRYVNTIQPNNFPVLYFDGTRIKSKWICVYSAMQIHSRDELIEINNVVSCGHMCKQ